MLESQLIRFYAKVKYDLKQKNYMVTILSDNETKIDLLNSEAIAIKHDVGNIYDETGFSSINASV